MISPKKRFYPLQFGFGDILEDGEIIQQIFRKNFSSSFFKILFHFVFWGGLSCLLFFLFFIEGWWIIILVIMYGLFRILYVFSFWYFNALLMTTEGLIFLEWKNFFHKKIMHMDYWGFDEMEVERSGLNAFVRNYGNIVFLKSGGGVLKEFKNANRPKKVVKIIEAYREQQIDEKNFTEESALKDLLSKLVKTHVSEHGQPDRTKAPSLHSKYNNILQKKNHKKQELRHIEIEKELDDDGGIEIDLEDNEDSY